MTTYTEAKNEVIEFFNRIKSRNLKVAIIDDDYQHGWDYAYAALFPNSRVTGYEYEGGESFPVNSAHNFDLILSDLRLTEVSHHNESDIVDIEKMSGMRKLREIREVDPLVPIIMCTASNKSWSHQSAIDYGANGYWEKESPDFGIGADYNLKNTINLLRTICDVLDWSNQISPVIEGIDLISDLVTDQNLRRKISLKKDAIIGQLHRPQSKYIREAYNFDGEAVAFLIVWSLINEISEFLRLEKNDVIYTNLGVETIDFCSKSGQDFVLSEEAVNLFGPGERPSFQFKDFDRIFLKFLFYLRKMKVEYTRLDYLRRVRNKLDYIHGMDLSIHKRDSAYRFKGAYLLELAQAWVKLLRHSR